MMQEIVYHFSNDAMMHFSMMSNYIYYSLRYFHFCQSFEITIFAEILKIVAIFRKDSSFRGEIFAKLSLKY